MGIRVLDVALALLHAGRDLRTERVRIRALPGDPIFHHYIEYDFNCFDRPMHTAYPSAYELEEYLVWMILHDDSRDAALLNFLSGDERIASRIADAGNSLARLVEEDHPEIVRRVRAFDDLTEEAARAVAEMLRGGSRMGYGNRESYENFFFRDGVFFCESGDPLASGPDSVERFESDEELVRYLIRFGWVWTRDGVLDARGDLARNIRLFPHRTKDTKTFRHYLENRRPESDRKQG